MKFIAIKTENGNIAGKISLYCQILKVSRQGYYNYLSNLNKPWKYEVLAAKMHEIIMEDECNDTYGRQRMYEALNLKKETTSDDFPYIPHERTVYRIMSKLGMTHTPKRKPNGITKADKEAMKSDDKLKRDFESDTPLTKVVTDITEIKTADGKLYVSVIEDCFDNAVLGLSMADNMRAELCVNTVRSAMIAYPQLRGAIAHSDRGSQYTSNEYRKEIEKNGIIQSMNSAGGRCHDNAKCESLWGRFKEELIYDRYDTSKMPMEEVKSLVWRYFMSYWNNRRICSKNGGLPPMIKRKRYYDEMERKSA